MLANKYDLVEASEKLKNATPTSSPTKSEKEDKAGATADGFAIPERQVSDEDIQKFTERTGLSVFEASAKTGSGVESSFIALTDALIDLAVKTNPKQSRASSKAETSTGGEAQEADNNNPYYYNAEGSEMDRPFEDGAIKMKRISGKDLGMSRADKAMMLCC